MTLYTGFQQAEDKYTNLLLGAGFNLGTIGALSFDGSQSWADVKTSDTASRQRARAIVSRPLQ
ncbi:fimbria/pilus outer membrane usher protein [Klebsiella pneumoniae]|uniref:fimbria/pilus outer membrane usher protein n=1 Tax=Klebsiella pneumoniae TaxID=573 RepID=UPI002265C122|nr:fimbria/pilus outer membrane usher protein [Klebsiella pneumoniae]